jgi:hypothetical protein
MFGGLLLRFEESSQRAEQGVIRKACLAGVTHSKDHGYGYGSNGPPQW